MNLSEHREAFPETLYAKKRILCSNLGNAGLELNRFVPESINHYLHCISTTVYLLEVTEPRPFIRGGSLVSTFQMEEYQKDLWTYFKITTLSVGWILCI